MDKLNTFKAKANEFATNQRSKIDSSKGKAAFAGKKEDEIAPRYFATIDVKDVSTFAPPPKRVGHIPGARTEDRDKGPSSPMSAARRESTASATTSSSTNLRPPPPLPVRSTRPPIASKPTSSKLPSRESAPIQDTTDPSPPSKEVPYGKFQKTFGTVVDSTTIKGLGSSLRNSTSPSNTTSTSASSPTVNMQDLRTASGLAQKYRTDPKSLSLSDAKAGLSVANKILPPSTDQTPPNKRDAQTAVSIGQKWSKDPKSLGLSDIKAGYAVANKFRPTPADRPSEVTTVAEPEPVQSPPEQKGVNDLKARFANVSLGGIKPPPSAKPSRLPDRSDTSSSRSSPPMQKRKPPPPPPPKSHANSSPARPQPPLNLSTKPQPSPIQSPTSWTPKDIPLNFETAWYSAEPMQQIPYLAKTPTKAISASSISASGSGPASHMTWLYTAVFAIRWTTDLSRTFIKVTWSSDDPVRTVRAQQKHFPPPPPLGAPDLEKAAGLYGAAIVRFAQVNLGRQVGNGECWTLAHDALEHVQGIASPRVMVSNGTIHGQCIYKREGGMTLQGNLENVRPGDVVQYLECKFERRENGRLVYMSTAGSPDHTSVVTGVRGGVVDILHQNVGGVRKVQKGELIVDEMVSGKLWIYRPVWETWAGDIQPKWQNGW